MAPYTLDVALGTVYCPKDAEYSTQMSLYLNPKLTPWIFDCLQTDCVV